INAECNSLVDEINRLYLTTEYNGINLFLETTTNASGDAEILQEVYADSGTTFEELGITSSSFSVYDINDNVLATYDIEGEDTLDDFFATLETHNFNPTIVSGKISVKSTDNSYIAGALADELGITTELESYVASTSQTSSAPVTYNSVSTSTTEQTVTVTTTTSTTQTQTVQVVTTDTQTSTETITVTTTSAQTSTETIYTTTTSEQTVTETYYVTTTTPNTVTETIEVQSTVGIAKSSNSKITYETTTVQTSYSVDLSATINIVVTEIYEYSAVTGKGERADITHVITSSEGFCVTIQDLLNLVRDKALNPYDTTTDIVFGTSENAIRISSMHLRLCWFDIAYIDSGGVVYPNNDNDGNVVFSATIAEESIVTLPSTQTATSTTKLSTIGVSSTQYITVQNNGTQTVITCKSSDTIGSVTAKLTSAGLTASFSSGKISIAASETSYISGISSTLASKLKLSGSYSSVKTTETETTSTIYVTTTSEETRTDTILVTTTNETTNTTTVYVTTTSEETRTNTIFVTTTSNQTQTQTLWTTTTSSETRTTTTYTTTTETATVDTSFADMGMKSGVNIGIVIDGNRTNINLSKDSSISDLISTLQANGLNASYSANKLTIEGTGDSYVSSSSLTNLFKLGTINKTSAERNVNTKSDAQIYTKNLLDELGPIYAPGSLTLQVGVNADSNSQVGVTTAFSLVGYNDFRGIGVDGNNYLAQLDATLEILNNRQVELGAMQNRLISALDEITVQRENLISSRSTLRDADIADISSEYIRQQILQQASATLLATANQSAGIALQLI
ncbi:MAG: hypothetical protein IJ331_05595, partial [Ruminococcus sp.]|nr:hypothetical protein [Ruminococcus sp.]